MLSPLPRNRNGIGSGKQNPSSSSRKVRRNNNETHYSDPALDRQSQILAILDRLVPPARRIELGRDSTKNRSRIPKNSSHDTLTKRTQSNSKPDVKNRSKK